MMPHRANPRQSVPRRRAFTLLELLVSISIIAVLISLFIPSIADLKESGRRVVCASSLRSLGTAISIYTSEHEALPVSSRYIGFAPPVFSSTSRQAARVTDDTRLELLHALGIGINASLPTIDADGVVQSDTPWLCPSEPGFDPGPGRADHFVDGFSYQYYPALLQARTIEREWWWDEFRVPSDRAAGRTSLRAYEDDPALILMRDDDAFHGRTAGKRAIVNRLTLDGAVRVAP